MRTILRIAAAVISCSVAGAIAHASPLTGGQPYHGYVTAVAPGFYGHTGVQLPEGTTCRGQRELILLTSNPRYSDILALLYTAQSAHVEVSIYAPALQNEAFGRCTIGEAALGNFAPWS